MAKAKSCEIIFNTKWGYCMSPVKCKSTAEALRLAHEEKMAFRIFVDGKCVKRGGMHEIRSIVKKVTYMEIQVVSGSAHCADLCTELRNNRYEIKEIGKEEYINEKLVKMSDDALLVKLADMFCNMSDNPTEQTVLRMQTNINYLLAHKEMNSTYKLLAEDIIEAGNVMLNKQEA